MKKEKQSILHLTRKCPIHVAVIAIVAHPNADLVTIVLEDLVLIQMMTMIVVGTDAIEIVPALRNVPRGDVDATMMIATMTNLSEVVNQRPKPKRLPK